MSAVELPEEQMLFLARGYNLNDTENKPKFQPPGSRRMAAQEEDIMKNPLDSLWGTVISGVLLTAILYFVVKSILT